MNTKNLLILLFVFGCCLSLQAQKKSTAKKPKKQTSTSPVKVSIQATYFVKNGQIKVRWAPANEESWRYGNRYGYIIERRTIVRGEKLLSGAEQLASFRSYPCIKDSLAYWEPLLNFNDNAAVMAQALYGESFQLDVNQSAGTPKGASLLSKSEENKQRYLFALYAADNDFNVAVRAGLGFLDTAAKFNEKYFYRIYSMGPKQAVKSDTAMLFITYHDKLELPATADIYIEPSNKSLVLSWDMDRTRSFYNSFVIQRSDDGGKTFRSVTRKPYTSMGQGNNPRIPNAVVYVDTAVQTGMNYHYRVAGINIFGERGPWSAVAEGKSLPLLEGVPGIQGIRLDAGGQPILSWFFEDSIRQKISGFDLVYAPKEDGPFQTILGGIPAGAKDVGLPDSLQAGYLIVRAVSKEGISRTSFPYLFQPEDSLPPSAPKGITASIDTTGRVELKWLPNTEKDLMGYKVFRTMVKGDEYAVLVDTVWNQTNFYDTLDLKLKNRKVYYAVAALDYRFNRSRLSAEVEVVKPDRIPPTVPVFDDYQLGEGNVTIKWINPEEEDLADVMVQRKLTGEWQTIFKSKTATTYNDKDVSPDKKYSYRLVAIDEAGHFSPDGQVLTVQTLPSTNRKVFTNVVSDLNREKRLIYLRWEVAQRPAIKSIEVFRGSDKEPLELYKVLDPKKGELLDNELIVNTKYKYGLRALLANGQYSELMIREINY